MDRPLRERFSLLTLFGSDTEILREEDLQILLLANIAGALGVTLLSPILDSLTGPFSVSPANVGLAISAYTAPAILVIPLAGKLSDRYGRKPLIVSGLLIIGLSGSSIVFAPDFRTFLALRLVQGIGGGVVSPIIVTSLGDIYTGTKETTAQGLRVASSGFTQVLASVGAGILVVIAWQFPFLAYLVCFPIAAVVYLRFEEPASEVVAPDGGETDPSSGSVNSFSFQNILSQRSVISFMIIRGLPSAIWVGYLTYNSVIIVRFMGGSPTEAGLLVAVGSFCVSMGAMQAGQISSIFDSRFYPLVVANLCLGIGFATVLSIQSIGFAVVGTVLTGLAYGVIIAIYRSIITSLAPPSLRGSMVGLSEAYARFIVTVTPMAMGAAIAATTPLLGFQQALRVVGLVVVVIVTGGGIFGLVIANTTPPKKFE
jgi:MFS family permease